MPIIKLKTLIKSDIQTVFDLSLSIDLHKISTAQTKEEAIAGVISGVIRENESVTWRAKHFGFYHTLTTKITAYNTPNYFMDEMTQGIFKKLKHQHFFKEVDDMVEMIDVFEYKPPLGILGKFADFLFLKNYMTKFLKQRNQTIKEFAETEMWREVLKS